MATKNLYLAAGPQSSGSTLISWCFLQRRDMDGILDANNDELSDPTRARDTPFVWVKTTISSFRLSEQIAHYQDLGWAVRPLLICRDVREVYASLRTKQYGRNGTTAEDPPLRLRLRRFREDWDLFHDNDWPILRYDEFLKGPEATLRSLCAKLQLSWDQAMLTWPKPATAILDTRHGNETFRRNCGRDLWSSLRRARPTPTSTGRLRIPPGELDWLEHEFARFNHVNGYPAHLDRQPTAGAEDEQAAPSYAVARRHKWKLHQTPLKYLLARAARWFQSAAPPPTNVKPVPTPSSSRPRVNRETPHHPGDDSRTDLGALAATGC